MISENKRNLTEKEEYYKLITDEKSNHIETNANGAGSQCVRRKNIGSCSFCVCDPGSHVLSVASLYESAPSGRARIPLSLLINLRN